MINIGNRWKGAAKDSTKLKAWCELVEDLYPIERWRRQQKKIIKSTMHSCSINIILQMFTFPRDASATKMDIFTSKFTFCFVSIKVCNLHTVFFITTYYTVLFLWFHFSRRSTHNVYSLDGPYYFYSVNIFKSFLVMLQCRFYIGFLYFLFYH